MKLIFTREGFYKKFKSIRNVKQKLNWADKLSKSLNDVYWNYTDDQIKELYNKYKIETIKGLNINQIYFPSDKTRIQKSKYKYFLLYLEQILIPSINSRIFSFKGDLKFKVKKILIRKNKLSNEEKYPLYDYRYDIIISYGEQMFNKTADRIEYYEYVIQQFNVQYKGHEAILDWYENFNTKRDINLLKGEIDRLKTVYEHEKDKMIFSKRKRITTNKQTIVRRKNSNDVDEKEVKPKNKSDKTKNIKVQKRIENLSNHDKPVWLRSEEELLQFLALLQNKQFIEDILFDPEWKQKYLACFVNKDFLNFSNADPDYLNWKERLIDLGYLLKELNQNRLVHFFDKRKYNVKFCNIFRRNGKAISPNNLSKAISDSKKSKMHHERLEEIISVLRKRQM